MDFIMEGFHLKCDSGMTYYTHIYERNNIPWGSKIDNLGFLFQLAIF